MSQATRTSLNRLGPLQSSMDFLRATLQSRIAETFEEPQGISPRYARSIPSFDGVVTPLTALVKKYEMSYDEFVALLLALAPHVQPDFLDQAITQVLPRAGEFPQLGGVRGKQFRGFLPTGETVLFVLAGTDLERRFQVQELFLEDHFFARDQILELEEPKDNEPAMSGRLLLRQDFADLLTIGHVSKPKFSLSFPAKRIATEMEWEDLILDDLTRGQIQELDAWIRHGDTILKDWGMRKRLKPGYRALFYGPAGTGKTLAASLLGKYSRRDVYRVDLSMVVSKFIGETEKNLANLFARAENKGWILFFDEADSLFGKRTSVRDAHDKYANQEVAYLLQRVEEYDGLVILASNLKSNIDEAFMRRFQLVVHFSPPQPAERLEIWKRAFPPAVSFAPDVDLAALARKYELTGAHIMNVVQYGCLRALDREGTEIQERDLLAGIQKEASKEGRMG